MDFHLIQVWDLRGRDAICSFKGHKAGVTHVKFSPDGKWVASASEDGHVKVRIHRTASGKKEEDQIICTSLEPKSCVCPFPVQIWDLVANKQLAELSGHTHAITGLHFHPVEYLLGTSSADKTIKVGMRDMADGVSGGLLSINVP